MEKHQIQEKLKVSHQVFAEMISSLKDDEFLFSANGKWNAGQQLDHIFRSVAALNTALLLPKFVIRLYVGKANRPSRDYDALVAKYKLKLAAGGKASGRFVPSIVDPAQKIILKGKLLRVVNALCKKINGYSEKQLDYYILPHPLLGKLTLREMLYFTIYHVEHHGDLTLRNIGR